MKKLLLSILMIMSMNAYSASIFFGHNSVGDNILQGIEDIGETSSVDISHTNIGENRDPISKMKDFEALIDQLHPDIAIMKFCYLDIEAMGSTDLALLYMQMVDRIQKKYPNLVILHMTMPIVNNPYDKSLLGSLKGLVRNALGKTPYTTVLNGTRLLFNNTLLTKYGDRVFDLAYIESYDGTYRENGVTSLYPLYSDDSQHLNDIGRKMVASEFVQFLKKWSK